jgi:hypothetical protein
MFVQWSVVVSGGQWSVVSGQWSVVNYVAFYIAVL